MLDPPVIVEHQVPQERLEQLDRREPVETLGSEEHLE